jgi:Tfp pilus assembly protein PilW
MRNPMRDTIPTMSPARRPEGGFSLIELLITALIFTIITGTALTLMSKHQPIFKQQQNQAALNIAMRNAVAQMQVDVINGGAGYYTGVNIPNWPVGIVINNNVVASGEDCHSGTTYGANCFDSFTIIASDANTTPVNILADSSANLTVAAGNPTATTTDTHATTSLYMLPPAGVTAATYAASFSNGDQVLLVKSDGSKYTTVKVTGHTTSALTVNGVSQTYVVLAHSTVTQSDGTNLAADDLTGMSVNSSDQTTNQFCAQDWLIRLVPIKYDVDITTDPDNPTLRRTVLVAGQTPDADGVALANQVIGFKVGAALIDGATQTTYNFDASSYSSDYTRIRSVMISLVGRTPPKAPNVDTAFMAPNTFDGGPYAIQGISFVISPRNMSLSEVGSS